MGYNKVKDLPTKGKKRKSKINLVFDEDKRRDFLGGFHKRNVQRKKKAHEALELKLKEEKKRIKQECKDSYKKLVVSRRPIPELEELLNEEYEAEDVTVKVVELSTKDVAEKSNWIGQNRPKEEENQKSESEDEEMSEDELPGMELKEKKRKGQVPSKEENLKTVQSKKEIQKIIKKQATNNVQKSKMFQKKNHMERMKNKKKSMRMKIEKRKFLKKTGKSRHKGSKGKPKEA